MDPEIQRFVEYLEERIQALQTVRDSVVELFADDDSLRKRLLRAAGTVASKTAPVQSDSKLLLEAPHTVEGNGNRGKRTRKEEITNFIQTHGPATRTQIMEGTHIPVGTLASVLNDKTTFAIRFGKWHLVSARGGAA